MVIIDEEWGKYKWREERKKFRRELGEHLAQVRMQCGLSVAEASALLNCNGYYLERLEKGKGDMWLQTMFYLAVAYDKKLVIRLE